MNASALHFGTLGPHLFGLRRLPMGPRLRAGALSAGAVVLWATWPALAAASAPTPPFLVFGLAAGVGFALSLLLAHARGEAKAMLRTPPRAVLTVVLGLLGHNVLFLYAVPRIGASEANVIAYLWPVMVVVLISMSLGERLRAVQWIGMAAAFAGVAVAIGPSFARGPDPIGITLALLSGLAFAVMSAVRSRGREERDVIGPSMGVIAGVTLCGHVLFEDRAALSLVQVLVIAGIGIAPVTLANALWDRATRLGQAALISGVAYATPIVALGILAALGLSAVTLPLLVGAGFVVGGAVLASGLIGRRGE